MAPILLVFAVNEALATLAHTEKWRPPMQVLSIPTATTLRSGSLPAAITPIADAPNGVVQPSGGAPGSGPSMAAPQQSPPVQPHGAVSVGLPQGVPAQEQHSESEAPAPSVLLMPVLRAMHQWHEGTLAYNTGKTSSPFQIVKRRRTQYVH